MFGTCRVAKDVRYKKSTMGREIMSHCVNQAVNIRTRTKALDTQASLGVSGRATLSGSQMGLALVERESEA